MISPFELEVVIRLTLAMILGAIIGLERGRNNRPAGIKTHALVCLGAALVMITSSYIQKYIDPSVDITRMGAQVISGIGFLGAGTIIITGISHVKGLTSAAGIWFAACLGLAVGTGYYFASIYATILLLFVVRVLTRLSIFNRQDKNILQLQIMLQSQDNLLKILERINEFDCRIEDMEVKHEYDSDEVELNLYLRLGTVFNGSEIRKMLRAIDGVILVKSLN